MAFVYSLMSRTLITIPKNKTQFVVNFAIKKSYIMKIE